MKNYIANYTDKRDNSWDLIFGAENWKSAHRTAVAYGRENEMKLESVRLSR